MKVIEVFASIQGEGRFVGRLTVFVRLAECNMRCSWCDTKRSWGGGVERTVDEVAAEVESYGITDVCITGGEPMLQKGELIALVKKLRAKKYRITLETNGSIFDKAVFAAVDSVACDMKPPSSGEKSDEKILAKLQPKDYVKVVVADERDLAYAKKIAEKSKVEVFLQPADAGKIGWLAKEVLKRKINARALPQLHKIIGVK